MQNKSQTTLYGSILPIVIIVTLILGAGYLLMGEDIKIPFLNKELEIQRLETFPVQLSVEDEREKVREIITSEEQLSNFLNQVDQTGVINFQDRIDFNRQYLLAVSSKTFEETGHDFKIKKLIADRDDKTYTIQIEQIDPDDKCNPEPDKYIWVDLVAVDKTDWKLEFEVVKKTDFCN